ncbi:MAG: phage virion morphogenesis protein [Nitrococcus mobilis]|nr:phage virion morphogenesis protein [Nitrococcus mobilis]
MAGVNIDVDDREIRRVLNALIRRAADLRPAFEDIGEALLNSTRDRFETQQAPDGSPWAPLSPRYQARKRRNRDKILVLDGYLMGLLRYQASDDELRVGTDRIYGATHQFGDPRRNIPARPFLGLSEEDRSMVLEVLREYLLGR